jgi:hypothetical protein
MMKKLQNKHMQEEWDREMDAIRQVVLSGQNVLSKHILEQMNTRGIKVQEVAAALLNGEIIEGFDVGQYSNYRNSDPFRTVVYSRDGKNYLVIGVALGYQGAEVTIKNLTTVYMERNIQTRRFYA